MTTFDFVANQDLRACLVSDYREMQIVLGAGAHKAVVVLAGSIIEAVLDDYLLAFKPTGMTETKILTMGLANAVTYASSGNSPALSSRNVDLCSVVRDYRNLIHPGVVARRGETADANSANVAANLVEMVCKDVAAAYGARRGLTAEQVVAMIVSDPGDIHRIPHLLAKMRASERQRLVVEVLPSSVLRELENDGAAPADDLARALGQCRRLAFENVSVAAKRKASRVIATTIREGSAEEVRAFDEVFVSAACLDFLGKRDQEVLLDHLLARIAEPTTTSMIAARGIGPHLAPRQALKFASPLIRKWIGATKAAQPALVCLTDEYRMMRLGARTTVKRRVDVHLSFYQEKQILPAVERVKRLKRLLDPTWIDPDVVSDEDIPF